MCSPHWSQLRFLVSGGSFGRCRINPASFTALTHILLQRGLSDKTKDITSFELRAIFEGLAGPWDSISRNKSYGQNNPVTRALTGLSLKQLLDFNHLLGLAGATDWRFRIIETWVHRDLSRVMGPKLNKVVTGGFDRTVTKNHTSLVLSNFWGLLWASDW